jgi:DNA repair exonuclease SbcCD ATPase subunit
MITIKRIHWKNLLGTGDEFTQIILNKHATTLISGKNGSGKSTLLDALTFALFGEPFRDINVPQLINDTNERDMLVEVEFVIGKTNYKVRRGLKPRTFEIFVNNKMLDQDAKARDYQKHLEQNILKLNKKSFKQVVVLGSAAFIPFMQLSAADRRAIIEDLLDIQIFSGMNQALKQRVSEMKDEYVSLSNQIELQVEKVVLVQSYLKKLKSDNAASIADKRQIIIENEQQREVYERQVRSIRDECAVILSSTSDLAQVKARIKKLESAEDKLDSNKQKANKEFVFFQDTNECPTCKQSIGQDFKNDMLVRKTALIGEIEQALAKLQTDLKSSEDRLDEINDALRELGEKEKQIAKQNSSIQAIDKYIKKVHSEIEDLQDSTGDIIEQDSKLKGLQVVLEEMNKQRDRLTERKHYLDIVAVMLKDTGIKTKIIRQYLPIINRYVNKYLAAMDFFANFTLDENFKEVIHIRGSKERTYYQLSEGQKLRIDLAILFTWREVAKLKNSANTNLLIMDEIFESALDDSGVDDFLKLIQTLSKDVNIFIISPKGDPLADKFTNNIKFIEERGFSVVEQ